LKHFIVDHTQLQLWW